MTSIDLHNPRDRALVEAMSRGDQNAVAALYDRHGAMLYALAMRIVRQHADAESVVLEAFMQAWRSASHYDAARASVAGWLVTLTRTRAIDWVRSRSRQDRLADAVADDPQSAEDLNGAPQAVEEQLEIADKGAAVTRALQQLPEAQRCAIELAFYEGLTHAEIAARLDQPLGTVKTRIRLGMTKLRDTLHMIMREASS